MSDVTICIVSFGDPAYYAAANQSMTSALVHTDADVFLLTDEGRFDIPDNPRITHLPVLRPEQPARRFMNKLEAWRRCLGETQNPVLVLMDADAVFAARAQSSELACLVTEKAFAMVEQTSLLQLEWERQDYWRHYCRTSLKAIDAHAEAPSLDNFRFFNSGFVVCRNPDLGEFLKWCDDVSPLVDFEQAAQTGETVTDQDFIQFWSNNLYPGQVSTLDWSWNHCSHWDTGFPRPDARVIHFSSFYHAPTPEVVASMRIAGRS